MISELQSDGTRGTAMASVYSANAARDWISVTEIEYAVTREGPGWRATPVRVTMSDEVIDADDPDVPMAGALDSALYRAALLATVSPQASGGNVAVATRQLAGDPLSPSVTFTLQPATSSDASSRASVVRSLGLSVTDEVGWAGCPAGTSRSTDRARCPTASSRSLAVGAPAMYPRDVQLGRLQSAACEAADAPKCWVVRVLETTLAPDGAQSRIEFLYFQMRDGRWQLADRKPGTYLE